MKCLSLTLLAACLVLNGCTAVDQNIRLSYDRNDHSLIKHSGAITVTRKDSASPGRKSSGKWIIGSLNNVHGVHQADLTADRSPAEWITDALLHELRAAGYTVSYADTLPVSATRGIALTNMAVVLDVNRGAVSADSSHELRFDAEVFLNGEKTKTFTVASRDNRTVPFDVSKEEKERIILQSLQDAMRQIIPEIISLIDKK